MNYKLLLVDFIGAILEYYLDHGATYDWVTLKQNVNAGLKRKRLTGLTFVLQKYSLLFLQIVVVYTKSKESTKHIKLFTNVMEIIEIF